jgi:hypothetical protein
VQAIVEGGARYPYVALKQGLETSVWAVEEQLPVACFAEAVDHIVAHPGGLSWAGAIHNRLFLFTLERRDWP